MPSLRHTSSGRDLLAASLPRVSSFLAEAAVLTLVLGILDRLVASHHVEARWVGASIAISLGLLAMSIALDLSARRWLPEG